MAINIARGRKSNTNTTLTTLQQGLAALDGTLTTDLATLTLSGESLAHDTAGLNHFNGALDALEPVIEAVSAMLPHAATMSVEALSAAQTAAAYGALMALNPSETARREILPGTAKNSLHRVISMEGHARSELAVESLDGNCGDHMITSTIMYNMGLCGYNGLVGNLYPMMVMDPSESGFRVMAKLIYVHNGMTHDPSGALANFKRTNLIRAYADHTVLESDGILAVPVYSVASAPLFVDTAITPLRSRTKGNETFQTSYIKTNVEFDLLGLSQTPNEAARGVSDITYALQRDITVSDVLVVIGADTFNFRTVGINTARFSQASQGDAYDMVLTMATSSLMVDVNTTLIDNASAPTEAALVALQAANATGFITLEMSGRTNIHTGKTRVSSVNFKAAKVVDQNGVEIPFTDPLAGNFKTLVDAGVVHGFDLKAFICPRNLSVECIQVLNDCYIEEHYIPHTCTITTKRYINDADQSDVDNLVQLSRVKMENAAATHLLTTVDTLEDLYKAARLEDRPDILGIGRLYVRPTFLKKTLDITTVSSRRAGERRDDIRAMINDALAEVASRLWTTSDLPAARCHLRAGDTSRPTVNIITSTHIGAYVAQTSQYAALSDLFNVVLITVPDRRFDSNDVGKIVITFSNYATDATSEFDPLSWGVLVQAPEVVYNINRPMGRAYVNDIMVSPRWKFIPGLPVAGVLTITGLSVSALGNGPLVSPW